MWFVVDLYCFDDYLFCGLCGIGNECDRFDCVCVYDYCDGWLFYIGFVICGFFWCVLVCGLFVYVFCKCVVYLDVLIVGW